MGKTLDALTRSAGTDTLIAAGEVVELRFRDGARTLSLRSAKLFHLLVEHAGAKACDDIEHRIPVADLNFAHVDSDALIECVRDLFGTTVELTYKTESGAIRTSGGPLLSMVDRPLDWEEGSTAELAFRLSPTLRLVLQNSNYWAALSRRAVLAFESRYALRLYEFMTLRGGLSGKTIETFELKDLRHRLGVPLGKLLRWSHFKDRALEPAISEVSKISGLQISYKIEKSGRKINRVTLSWSYEAEKEQAKTILKDTKEAPTYTQTRFPTYGGLKHGQQVAHWRDLAEAHVQRIQGGHLPDLSELADQFRAWCARKNLPLDASGIEKAFIGFCQKYRPPHASD